MSRTVFVSVILALVVLAGPVSASLSNTQGRLGAKNSREKIAKTHLGKALLGLLELEAKAAAGDGVDKLFSALSLLKENLLEKKEAEIADFAEDGEAHQAEVNRINNLLAQYASQITVVKQEIEDLKTEADSLNSDLALQNRQLTTATNGVEQEKQTLINLENNFKQAQQDYQEAIDILAQAIAKLQEARDQQAQNNAANTYTASLLQVTDQEQWRYFADNLEAKIKKTKKDAFIKPLVNFFSQMSSTDGVDADSAERAQNALVELRIFYEASLQSLGETYENQVSQHESLLTQLENQIDTLQNIVIPRTTADLEANSQNQVAKQNELTDAEANVEYQQGQLQAENESWGKRIETHELLVPEYDDEYATVVQAENVLRQTYPNRD